MSPEKQDAFLRAVSERIREDYARITTPPEPKSHTGPLERVTPEPEKQQGERFSHTRADGYRVWVDAQGKPVRVERPLRDSWVWG